MAAFRVPTFGIARIALLATVHKVEESKPDERKVQKQQSTGSQAKKSQHALLAGALKRKSTDVEEDGKKRKISESDTGHNSEKLPAEDSKGASTPSAIRPSLQSQTAQVVGVLPSLVAYDDGTSDSESSSDSDIDFSMVSTANKIMMVVNNEIRQKMS
ncbi:hypothetical protein ScPMuIL_001945 [Solemya velum]